MPESPGESLLINLHTIAQQHTEVARGVRLARPTDHINPGLLSATPSLLQSLTAASSLTPPTAVVLDHDGVIMGVCVYDSIGRAHLGPLFVSPALSRSTIEGLVRSTMLYMHHVGYRYAIAAPDVAQAAGCDGVVLSDKQNASIRERDTSDAWADIFIPLDRSPNVADRIVTVDDKPVLVRRPKPSERLTMIRFVEENWGHGWASEVDVAMSARPFSCIVAVRPGIRGDARDWLVGFMTYNVTAPGFTSSTGIVPDVRGRGVGLARSLFQRTLSELTMDGFTFAILGGVSRRIALLRESPGAFTVPGSYPGVFAHGEDAASSD